MINRKKIDLYLPGGVYCIDQPLEGEVAEGGEGRDPGDEPEDFSFRNHFVRHDDDDLMIISPIY